MFARKPCPRCREARRWFRRHRCKIGVLLGLTLPPVNEKRQAMNLLPAATKRSRLLTG